MTSFLFATLSLCQPEFHSSHHILKVADTRQIHFGNEILNQMKMCVTLQKHLFKIKKNTVVHGCCFTLGHFDFGLEVSTTIRQLNLKTC